MREWTTHIPSWQGLPGRWRQWQTRLLWAVMVALVCALLGCGSLEQDLTLYRDGSYELVGRLTVPRELSSAQEIERYLDSQTRDAARQGIHVTWRKLGSSAQSHAYRIAVNGDDYAELEGDDIRIREVQWEGTTALRVECAPNWSFSDFKFTVHGSRILESNGWDAGRGAVTWHNPAQTLAGATMVAVLTPKSRFPVIPVIVVGLAAAGAILAYSLYRVARQRRSLVPAVALSPQRVFCPYCGQPGAVTMRFCMHCGREIPRR